MTDKTGEGPQHKEVLEQQVPQYEATVVKPKQVRLSPNPPPYKPPPRSEPGPEAMPPATIHGKFRPIKDRGPETAVPERDRHEPWEDDGEKDAGQTLEEER